MDGPIDLKHKGYELTGLCLLCVTLTFDLTHDLDLDIKHMKDKFFEAVVGTPGAPLLTWISFNPSMDH